MRILFLSPFSPYPPDEGGKRRVYHLLEHLRQQHQVTLITYDRGETGNAPAGMRCIRVPYRGARGSLLRRAARLCSRLPDLAAKLARPELRTAVRQELALRPALVWVEESPLAHALPARLDIPLIIGEQNIESELWRATGRGPRAEHEQRRLRAFETKQWQRAGALAVVSAEDAAAVRARVPSARVVVLANGVDTAAFTPPRAPRGPLLFVGSLGHPPNRDGLRWLLRDILPRLRARVPEARLLIAGRGSETLRDLPAGVQTLGCVADIRDVYRRGALLLVPLRDGGGSRLKIVEAWASGLPVVSTTAGAAGLRDAAAHCAIADTADAFADATALLLAQPARAEELARQARRHAERHYSWQATLAPLDALLAQAVKQ